VTLTKEDISRLWSDYTETRSHALRNGLAEYYLPLVRKIGLTLSKRLPDTVDLDDLVQAGAFGLMRAIERFEPARGLAFSTLASKKVFGAMLDSLREYDWVPRVTRQRTKIIGEAVAEFEAEHGRTPTREELRARVPMDAARFASAVKDQAVSVLSTEMHVTEGPSGEAVTIGAMLRDRRSGAEQVAVECRDLISVVIRDMGVTQALFLRLYYLEGLTLEKVGGILGGHSESRASQLRTDLVARLRFMYGRRFLADLPQEVA
jgi:RNA polymerase sigma factor FliA